MAEKILAARHRRDASGGAVASRIIADVRRRGDAALFALDAAPGRHPAHAQNALGECERAARRRRSKFRKELRRALEHAARNIRRVAEEQRPRSWSITVEPGVRVGQRVSAIETIGCYIPGGRFSLVSTLLMTAIPAQVAGVRRIVVACPRPNAALLAAAEILGRRGNRAHRRRAGHRRVRLRHAIGSARGQNLWAGKSLRHGGQAAGERRLRDRSAGRPDGSSDRRHGRKCPAISPRISGAGRARSRRGRASGHHVAQIGARACAMRVAEQLSALAGHESGASDRLRTNGAILAGAAIPRPRCDSRIASRPNI